MTEAVAHLPLTCGDGEGARSTRCGCRPALLSGSAALAQLVSRLLLLEGFHPMEKILGPNEF